MKRLIRYRKKIVSLMCAFMIGSIGIFSTSFVSKASENSFHLNYPQPTTSSNQGYISLACRVNSSGDVGIFTFFWNTFCVDNGLTSPSEMMIGLTNNSATFNIIQDGATSGWYTLSAIDSEGNYFVCEHTNSSAYTYNFGTSVSIIGWKIGGNAFVTGSVFNSYDFTLYFTEDATEELLWQIIETLTSDSATNESILLTVFQIKNSVDDVKSELEIIVEYLENCMNDLDSIRVRLEDLFSLARAIYTEEQAQSSWLSKIFSAISKIANKQSADNYATEKYKYESSVQKGEIDSLNGQNQSNQVDVNSASSQVDANINYDNMSQYGGVLATITNNNYVLQMILIVVSVAVIAYVLFGKR